MNDFKGIIAKRKRQDFLFNIVGIICTLVGIVTLGALLVGQVARFYVTHRPEPSSSTAPLEDDAPSADPLACL